MTLEESVIANTPKNDLISWKRKRKNVEKLVEELKPIEDQIAALLVKKQVLHDKIANIRSTMIAECIHPSDCLVTSADEKTLHCKFCDRELGVV